jgi:excisionase family DNA binding protein
MYVSEAAREIRVSERTIRRAIASGELRALRLGENGRYRIRSTDLDDFLRVAEPRP